VASVREAKTSIAKEDEMAEQHPPEGKPQQAVPDARKPTTGNAAKDDGLQGEGNYAASQRYRDELEEFIKTADIERAAHEAAPKDQQEARDMADAEAKGRARKKT
jgi:hypothetical protein